MQRSTRSPKQDESRRKQYRIDRQREHVQAHVVHGDREIPVQLIDTSFGGAGFASPPALDLKLGDTITLRFSGPDMDLPASVRSVIQDRTPHGSDIRYGAEFIDPSSLHRRLPPRLLGLFNRRQAFRVTPDSSSPIQARVRRLENELVVGLQIVCISVAGCALVAKRKEDQLLMAGDVIELSFTVPDTDNTVVFVGTVRYCRKLRGGMRLGVEFDRRQSPVFNQQQTVLSRYIMQQQRRMLDTAR